MGRQRKDQLGTARNWATHLLFVLHLVVFLVLVVGGKQAPWYSQLLHDLALGGFASFSERPWSLLTHTFIHRHYLEFILTSGILLLAGAAVESRLGTSKFLGLYFGTVVLTGGCHLVLVETQLVPGQLLGGSIGATAGLLTAYLFLFGRERRVGGSLPFPAFYLMAALTLLAVVATLEVDTQRALESQQAESLTQAYEGEGLSVAERVRVLHQLTVTKALRPDHLAHLLGLMCGGLALMSCLRLNQGAARIRLNREIKGLQREVDARARVELLLEKISQEGMEALTRPERKFLRYASRYYQSGRLTPPAKQSLTQARKPS